MLALILAAALLGLRRRNVSSSAAPNAAEIGPAAHESYLKGLGYLERYDKPGNLDSAIALFEGSVKVEPNFALGFTPWARLIGTSTGCRRIRAGWIRRKNTASGPRS